MSLVRASALEAAPQLARDDIAWGWVHGRLPETQLDPVWTSGLPASHPRQVLEELLLPALATPPVVLAFSGGRDSSALLAVAVDLARREGLDEPVPLTLRYPNDPDADETSWQELVVAHLKLRDWQRLVVTDQADFLGAYGCEVLRVVQRPIFPFGALVGGIEAEVARGGWLLSGEWGDFVFSRQRLSLLNAAVRKRALPPRIWAMLAKDLAPGPVRGTVEGRAVDGIPWLTPQSRQRLRRAIRRDVAAQPLRADRELLALGRQALYTTARQTMAAVTAAYGATRLDPYGEPRFIIALARLAGWRGFCGRADMLRRMFGDLLPESLISRTSKASFNRARLGPATRDWLRTWDGSGLDTELVRPGILRQALISQDLPFEALGLLQQAWLATQTHPSRSEDCHGDTTDARSTDPRVRS